MDALNQSLFKALASYKKVPLMFSAVVDMPPGEYFGLLKIEHLAKVSEGEVNVSDIQFMGNMTMPAVSQMLNALERKGLIVRGISSTDRRKITVSITESGKAFLKTAAERSNLVLSKAVALFGEEDTRQLIELSGRFVAILDETQQKVIQRLKDAQNIDGTIEGKD